MASYIRSFGRDDGGLAAVEFALLAPVLMVMLVGMIDFGMFINQKMQLENLARASAEYVVKGGDEANVETDVLGASGLDETALAEIEATSETVCECSDGAEIVCGGTCDGDGYQRSFYAFSMSRTYTPLFSYPGMPEQITMTGNARLQIQ